MSQTIGQSFVVVSLGALWNSGTVEIKPQRVSKLCIGFDPLNHKRDLLSPDHVHVHFWGPDMDEDGTQDASAVAPLVP